MAAAAITTLAAAILSGCGGDDDDQAPGKAGILPPEATVTIPPLTATPQAGISVFPNGDWVDGLNAAVIQGGGMPPGVGALVQNESRRKLLAIWLLSEGRWLWSVPSMPQLDGGIREFRTQVVSVIFVLEPR
jgi:hypothetical protein